MPANLSELSCTEICSDTVDAPRRSLRAMVGLFWSTLKASMSEVGMIGLDLAKHVFQLQGADGLGRPVLRKRFRRRQGLDFLSRQPRCIVAMKACSDKSRIGDAPHCVREANQQGVSLVALPQRRLGSGAVDGGPSALADLLDEAKVVAGPSARLSVSHGQGPDRINPRPC